MWEFAHTRIMNPICFHESSPIYKYEQYLDSFDLRGSICGFKNASEI